MPNGVEAPRVVPDREPAPGCFRQRVQKPTRIRRRIGVIGERRRRAPEVARMRTQC